MTSAVKEIGRQEREGREGASKQRPVAQMQPAGQGWEGRASREGTASAKVLWPEGRTARAEEQGSELAFVPSDLGVTGGCGLLGQGFRQVHIGYWVEGGLEVPGKEGPVNAELAPSLKTTWLRTGGWAGGAWGPVGCGRGLHLPDSC